MHLEQFHSGAHSNPGKLRHTHPYHELLAVHEGRGQQLVAHDEVPCTVGDVFVFPSGCPHLSHTGAGEMFSSTVLYANGSGGRDDGVNDLIELLVERLPGGGRLHLRPAAAQRVAAFLRRAMLEWSSRELGSRHVAGALLTEALAVLARDVCTAPPGHLDAAAADRHVAQAQRWIGDYWMTPVRIADLVALGPLGRSQFLARFRCVAGATVGEALLAIRLREAQRLMREGRLNLLDVALACGFGSQSHFNHRFKTATGLSPRAWLSAQA